MSDCIEWDKSRNIKNGNRFDYGQVRVGAKMKKAHRIAWENVRGPIPAGMLVLHRCDNPPCVNVDHLFLGTHSDNALDRERKGRGKKQSGADNPRAKISEQTAVAIKISGRFAVASDVARRLGISPGAVCKIMNGEAWRDVTSKTRYAF